MENLIDLIDDSLLNDSEADKRYIGSKFEKIRYLHPKIKGSRFEKITKNVLEKIGLTVYKPKSTDHDMIVNQEKIEVKGSTLIMNKNQFTFLQIRPDQDYDKILFVMAYPKELKIIEMDKNTTIENIENGTFRPQHGGKKGNSRTFCYYGNYESLLKIGGKPLQIVNK